MADYNEKTDWQADDPVTESDFNRIEQGVADAHGKADQNETDINAHISDDTIHFQKSDVSKSDVGLENVDDVKQEPAFSKNTAFNKNFGTGSGTVAEGDHTHDYVSGTTGSYVGDGTASRTINVGFTPSFVLISNSNNQRAWMVMTTGSGIYFDRSDQITTTDVELEDNGFSLNDSTFEAANYDGHNYFYVAFK
ncbi:hypothetical protein [Salibacterium aidingense]|uniref:hypothetical protein n=1 Tax=Salibacterium aidingense TaxID=384933 RepID=UPI003BC79565